MLGSDACGTPSWGTYTYSASPHSRPFSYASLIATYIQTPKNPAMVTGLLQLSGLKGDPIAELTQNMNNPQRTQFKTAQMVHLIVVANYSFSGIGLLLYFGDSIQIAPVASKQRGPFGFRPELSYEKPQGS